MHYIGAIEQVSLLLSVQVWMLLLGSSGQTGLPRWDLPHTQLPTLLVLMHLLHLLSAADLALYMM